VLTESYWPADLSEPVLENAVGGVLRDAVEAVPDRVALVAGVPALPDRRRWTYADLLDEAESPARALLERFEPGEHLAVWAPNLPEWVILEFAAGLAGLTLVTVNPAYKPTELAYVLEQSGAAGILFVPKFRSPMASYLEEVRPQLPNLREVVLFTEWDTFVRSGSSNGRLPEVGPDDIAQIQYTSGTTGFPKGARLHHRGLTNNARFFAQRIGIGGDDVFVNPMPLFYTAGSGLGVLGCVQARATNVPVLAFEPALVLELIESERSTAFSGVPTMLIAMLEHPDFERRDLSTIRVAVSGGSPVPADLFRRVEQRMGARFSIVFGTTECSPLLTQVRPNDDPKIGPGRWSGRCRKLRCASATPSRERWSLSAPSASSAQGDIWSWPGTTTCPRPPSRSSTTKAGTTRRSRIDGRARVSPDRRQGQGHDHPRGREHLPPRDRGRALCPSLGG
jgi:fatty-acyl-CoA synthase